MNYSDGRGCLRTSWRYRAPSSTGATASEVKGIDNFCELSTISSAGKISRPLDIRRITAKNATKKWNMRFLSQHLVANGRQKLPAYSRRQYKYLVGSESNESLRRLNPPCFEIDEMADWFKALNFLRSGRYHPRIKSAKCSLSIGSKRS